MKDVSELLDLLKLERLEDNLFRGQSSSIGSKRVFGGQVLAQAVSAAIETVPEDRYIHSLHSYFILPGDISIPIVFQVEKTRDGGSFTTRLVKAIQKGQIIFRLMASFQLKQEGFDHQLPMPTVVMPEKLSNWKGMAKEYGDQIPENFKKVLNFDSPIEFRPVERFNPFKEQAVESKRNIWMRAKGKMPNDINQHNLVLAYASDYNLLTTSLLPHGQLANFPDMTLASLDHAMWFHRPFRIDDWLLYHIDTPSASGGRGFSRGSVFTKDGRLVASVVQEGLIRPKRKK